MEQTNKRNKQTSKQANKQANKQTSIPSACVSVCFPACPPACLLRACLPVSLSVCFCASLLLFCFLFVGWFSGVLDSVPLLGWLRFVAFVFWLACLVAFVSYAVGSNKPFRLVKFGHIQAHSRGDRVDLEPANFWSVGCLLSCLFVLFVCVFVGCLLIYLFGWLVRFFVC